MPVYAPTPEFAGRRAHPRLLVLIVAGHAAVIAAVMSAKMDLPPPFVDTPTIVEPIPIPEPPPPEPQPPKAEPEPRNSVLDQPRVIIPVPQPDRPQVDTTPVPLPIPNPGDLIGPSLEPQPQPGPAPSADPVRTGPRFATPPSRVRPPYPPAKLRTEEEAALRLRLSIDERGRVVAVEPVGPADRVFLEAARRHLITHWRYQPATEDGRAVPSTTVITLRFELEG